MKVEGHIRINDDISVTVLDVHGQQVRLGIKAPEQVAVHREEIYQRIQAQKCDTEAAWPWAGNEPGETGCQPNLTTESRSS